MADQTTTERFIADTSAYVRRVEEAAREADAFGRSNSEAALAARQMGVTARDAAERAGRAMREAANAAERLAREEISADEAARAAARGARELERADIAQARAAAAAARATNQLADEQRAAARAAVEAAALQRLAALRAQGDIRGHNLLLSHLRQNYDGAGRDIREMSNLAGRAFDVAQRAGTQAFSRISSSADKFADSGPLGIAKVVAALALVPVAAIAAAGAVTLVLGGALAGIGIMAAIQSKQVKSAFSSLASDAKKQATAWAAPWKPALISIAQDMQGVVAQFDLKPIFAEMAPAVQRFAHEAGQGLLELRPALTAVGHGFSQLLDQLGPELPGIMRDLGDGITQFAQTAGEHAQEFAQLGVAIGALVKYTAKAVDVFADIAPVVNLSVGFLDLFGIGAKKAADGLDATTAAAGANSAAMGAMGAGIRNAAGAIGDLKARLDELTGKTLSSREAARNYQAAIDDMTASLKENGRTHDITTAKGRANQQQLDNLAKTAQANAVAMDKAGRSTRDVGIYMDGARSKIVATAVKMGYTSGEASTLANRILGVTKRISDLPSGKRIKITADISAALQNIYTVGAAAAALGAGVKMHIAKGGYIGSYADGGPVRHYATAGYVSGPGTSTSDSIPAMVSNGEYVVKASATAMNRAALDAANYQGAQLMAISKSAWGKASIASDPWGKATVFGNNPDPRPRTIVKPPPRMPPHHGLQSYGSSYGQQQQVIQNVYIAGAVTTEQALLSKLQTLALQQGTTFTLPAGR